MKVILNATAVRALLETDPEPMAEIAKNAAAQVAEALKRTMTKDYIESSISRLIQEHMTSGSSYRPKLTQIAHDTLKKFLADEAAKLTDRFEEKAIRETVLAVFNSLWEVEQARLRSSLTTTIDQLLRERFAAMFAAAP